MTIELEAFLSHWHRDRSGDIGRRHGNTQVRALRQIYGTTFALGFTPNAKLSDALAMLDDRSLAKLVHDHEAGTLEGKLCDPGTPLSTARPPEDNGGDKH